MVNTNLKSAISAGLGVVATPTSMAGITAGAWMIVGGEADTDTGRGEIITVTSVTSTTFIADFAHAHEKHAVVTDNRAYEFAPNCVMWGT